MLAAAQGDASSKEQVQHELLLLLSMLSTFTQLSNANVLVTDTVAKINFLAAAATRHMTMFHQMTQAGNLAVELLAYVLPVYLQALSKRGGWESCSCVGQARLAGLQQLLDY